MIDDEPTTPTPTTPPPVGKATKKNKDVPGFRFDKRDTVTIQELCVDLKINCAVVRKKLRDANEKKSLYGNYEWLRNSPELKRVRKLLMA